MARLLPLALLLGLAAQPAAALTFSFSTIAGDTLTTSEAAAFRTAANAWSTYLVDPVTVVVRIGFRSLGSNILGQTAPTYVQASAAAAKTLLAADAKDATDRAAVASLATSTQTSLTLTTADARAIGFSTAAGTDGTIEFSTNYTFSDTRDANGGVASGSFDLIGIAEHEIGHLLGFDSSIDGGTGGVQTLLDQFRFAAAGTRSVTAGAAAYFSIDNGVTDINAFSVGGSGNSQASHWLQGTGAVMDPESSAGATQNIKPLDIQALDAIGYDVAVPEPESLALLGLGLVGVLLARRRPGG